jgi:ABC-type transport system involved in multi-copper enzyme maturation permease subunit
MWKALALKEIRECLVIALVALAVSFYLVARNTGWESGTFGLMIESLAQLGGLNFYGRSPDAIPFVASEFIGQLNLVLALFAMTLGFRQSVGESLHGTYPLLLHLPVSRTRLMAAKVTLGLGVYLVCGAVPILVYSLWAATPGTHASPFYWSMTAPVWMAWLAMSCLYLAAFLSGLRPARWYGSRLAPLAAGLPALFVTFGTGLSWWSVLFVTLTIVLLVASIRLVAQERDFG